MSLVLIGWVRLISWVGFKVNGLDIGSGLGPNKLGLWIWFNGLMSLLFIETYL